LDEKDGSVKVDAHEKRALQLEHAIAVLGDPTADPDIVPSLIENYWAAAFHWIAVGCQRKHGQHKENHTQLGRYLRDLAETAIATHWDALERARQGALYAYSASPGDSVGAHDDWQAIRTWALS
jgi:hypothetical protein